MPHGELKRYEILSKVYRLKEEVSTRELTKERRDGADEYLNKVLDFISEYTY